MRPAEALPAGVVFDCDGTLVDTEPIADRTWAEVLGRRGYVPSSHDTAHVLGRHYEHTFAYFDERAGGLGDPAAFRDEMRTVFAERFAREVVVFADAVSTLRALAEADVPVGVASSSSRTHIARVLEHCGITTAVAAIVGAEDTDDHKPHPDPYLLAARLLEVEPHRCSAVEDSRVGIAAAKAAGMFTVAVRRGHVPDADLREADRIVDLVTPESLLP